jgi:hypothetical protein
VNAHSHSDVVNGLRRASVLSAETKATDRDAELNESLFTHTTPLNEEVELKPLRLSHSYP